MATMIYHSTARKCIAAIIVIGSIGIAWAEDIGVSAKIDKTTTEIRSPVTLTITLTGNLLDLDFLPPQLPDGFILGGRSQATSFAVHNGAAEQSSTITYLLVPQKPGTFKLGPFAFRHRGKLFQTDPIEVTVKKAVLPPTRQIPAERYTI